MKIADKGINTAIRHHQLPLEAIIEPLHLFLAMKWLIKYIIIINKKYMWPLFFIKKNGTDNAIANNNQTIRESSVFVYFHDNPILSFEHGFEHWFFSFAAHILGNEYIIYNINGIYDHLGILLIIK